MRTRLAEIRERVRTLLDREAKVRDLVKATIPLWAWTVVACGAAIAVLAYQGQLREDDVEDGRLTGCLNHNVEQQGDRESTLNSALVMFGFAESGNLTAAERAVIVAGMPPELQRRYDEVEAQAAINNPFRDCSASGLAAYYANPPDDPAVATTANPIGG